MYHTPLANAVTIFDRGATVFDRILEYGLAGVVISSVMAMIVAPVVKAIIAHSKGSLKLLEKAVDQNTKAIESFQRLEEKQDRNSLRIADTQREIMHSIRDLRQALAFQKEQ